MIKSRGKVIIFRLTGGSIGVFMWIGPEAIPNQRPASDFVRTQWRRHFSQIIQAGQFRTDATVHTEILVHDEGRQRQAVEDLIHTSINPRAGFAIDDNLLVKAIFVVDGLCFMISSENFNLLGVADLHLHQDSHNGKAKRISIDVVTQKHKTKVQIPTRSTQELQMFKLDYRIRQAYMGEAPNFGCARF